MAFEKYLHKRFWLVSRLWFHSNMFVKSLLLSCLLNFIYIIIIRIQTSTQMESLDRNTHTLTVLLFHNIICLGYNDWFWLNKKVHSKKNGLLVLISGYFLYPTMFLRSSSTDVIPPRPKFSTNTFRTFGETKAGNVGPIWIFLMPR